MKADAAPILGIFEKKARLDVPLFQRKYVWEKEKHWEPLWDDIKRKVQEIIDGRSSAPSHFLGAMVLDQKQTPTTHVEKRTVIDGQQRLTTFQIILAALRDFSFANNLSDLSNEFKRYTLNDGLMANKEEDKYKLWPTLVDRPQFCNVITSFSKECLLEKYPLIRRKYQRQTDPRPPMIEAYLFYYDSISAFIDELSIDSEIDISAVLQTFLHALRQTLKVVVIDLDNEDDPQVIFETLNARGEPLLPGDLLRNYVFHRVVRAGKNSEELYQQYWANLDEEFWRETIRQGRITRPKSDAFIQSYLSIKAKSDIAMKHLFVEYKHWIEKSDPSPFAEIEDELIEFNKYSNAYKKAIELRDQIEFSTCFESLEAMDVGTALPLFMTLIANGVEKGEIAKIAEIIESYVMRRAVCGMTQQNYNKIFIGLANHLAKNGFSAERCREYLAQPTQPTSIWPTDERISATCKDAPIYFSMNSGRLVYILSRLSRAMSPTRAEQIADYTGLSIEHIMPQEWEENWPITLADDEDLDAGKSRRESFVHKIGNLTILTQSLNSSVSNGSWIDKKQAIMETSLLEINRNLASHQEWDEQKISMRSELLSKEIIKLWKR